MAAERFSNLNRKHRLLAATKREQTIQYNITITDKEILVYILLLLLLLLLLSLLLLLLLLLSLLETESLDNAILEL